MTRYSWIDSPVGALLAVDHGDGLAGLYFEEHRRGAHVDPAWHRDDPAFRQVAEELLDYFDGRRRSFDVPLAPTGTPFQRRVWDALRAVPFGATVTYGRLAASLGHPSASRAVGAAVGRNPVSIIVPCHRVVGARGTLTGYAGGLQRKRALLAVEGIALAV